MTAPNEAISVFSPHRLIPYRRTMGTDGVHPSLDGGVRLNVGWVECLVLSQSSVRVLVYKKTSPAGIKFDGTRYEYARGCDMTTVSLSELNRVLPSLAKSHHDAISIAAKRPSPKSIRDAHSAGITKFLSLALHRSIPNPSYLPTARLHLLNGGYGNGDKRFLERVALGSRRAKSWVVPKSAAIGDEVVINVAGFGLFATGRIASKTTPRTDWPNRYGAALDSIQLIEPPISLAEVQRRIPALKWARYPRSISTPSPDLAERIRDLVRRRIETSVGGVELDRASPEQLDSIASMKLGRPTSPRQRTTNQFIRCARVRKFVLNRANGFCEGCSKPAPFIGRRGLPFLETHHTKPISDGGPDHPWYVIALCPNCHRRTDSGNDSESFNASLTARLEKLYPTRRKT